MKTPSIPSKVFFAIYDFELQLRDTLVRANVPVEEIERVFNCVSNIRKAFLVREEKEELPAAPTCLHPDLVCDQQAPSPTFSCAVCGEHVSWQTVYRRLHVKIENLHKTVKRLDKNEELYGTTKT